MKRMGIKAAILALCVAFLCFFGGALLRYARPMENASYDFSLSWAGEAMPDNWQYDQKGWSVFTLEGGERRELAADGLGGFYGAIEPGGVFYFSRVLTEAAVAPTLQIAPSSRAIAVFLDGECLYSDGSMDAAIGEVELADLGWTRSAPRGCSCWQPSRWTHGAAAGTGLRCARRCSFCCGWRACWRTLPFSSNITRQGAISPPTCAAAWP